MKDTQIGLWYSGKAHEHGGNVQAMSVPLDSAMGGPMSRPGSVHGLIVARDRVLGTLYWAASRLDLPTLADGGYDGAGIGVHTPIKQLTGDQILDVDNRAYDALLRGLRCIGERDFPSLPAAGELLRSRQWWRTTPAGSRAGRGASAICLGGRDWVSI